MVRLTSDLLKQPYTERIDTGGQGGDTLFLLSASVATFKAIIYLTFTRALADCGGDSTPPKGTLSSSADYDDDC